MSSLTFALFATRLFGQNSAIPIVQKPRPATAKKPLISAVLNDGKTLEPVAYLSGGKLEQTVDGSDAMNIIVAFDRSYYPKGRVYPLIFGGKQERRLSFLQIRRVNVREIWQRSRQKQPGLR